MQCSTTADSGKLIVPAVAAHGIISGRDIATRKAASRSLSWRRLAVHKWLVRSPEDTLSLQRTRALDRLNARFGPGTIGFGTAGKCRALSLWRKFISPRFTTDWNKLLRA